MATAVVARRPRIRRGWQLPAQPLPLAAGGGTIVLALTAALVARDRSQFLVLAFLAVAGLSMWCLTTRNPRTALVVVMLYIGLADGFVKLRIDSQPATLLRDILLYAVIVNVLVRKTRPAEGQFFISVTAGLVVAFGGLVFVQTLHPGVGSTLQAIGGLRLHLEFAPLFFLGFLYLRTDGELTTLLVLLVAIGTINAIVNIVQSGLSVEQFASWGPGYRDKLLGSGNYAGGARVGFANASSAAVVRPFGLGSDIGFGAGAAALAIPSALALSLRARTNWQTAACGFCTVLCVAGLAVGGARVTIITGVVGLALFLSLATLSRQVLRVVGTSAAITALALVLLPVVFGGSSSTVFERFQSLAPSQVVGSTQKARGGTLAVIPDYLERYPVGAGVGQSGSAAQFANLSTSLNAESEFTFLAIETGLIGVGLVLWLNISGAAMLVVGRRRIEDPQRRTAVVAICAPLAGLLPLWVAAPTTAAPPFSAYFWLALGVASYHLADRSKRA